MVQVKVLSAAFDKLLRRIIKVRRYSKFDTQTASEFLPFGVDSSPLPGMVAAFMDTDSVKDSGIVGYVNVNQLAEPGETRLFALDADGKLKGFIWLKKDGTYHIGGSTNHLTQYEELKIAFDKLKSDFNALVTTYNAHTHTGVTTGGGVTGPTPSLGASSTADMSGAKLDNLKTA